MTVSLAQPPSVQPLPLPGRRGWLPVDSLSQPAEYTQGSLALSYRLPAGVSADPQTTALVLLPHGARDGSGGTMEAWAARFIQAVIEVIASDRPVSQLVRWTSRRVYADIAERQRRVAEHRRARATRSCRQHVATVRVSRPTGGCAEVAARVTFGARSRAVAARLDYVNGRWLCTAISFG
jgi:fermentation-respiration switch protein FrsA (DUF1100 family)